MSANITGEKCTGLPFHRCR